MYKLHTFLLCISAFFFVHAKSYATHLSPSSPSNYERNYNYNSNSHDDGTQILISEGQSNYVYDALEHTRLQANSLVLNQSQNDVPQLSVDSPFKAFLVIRLTYDDHHHLRTSQPVPHAYDGLRVIVVINKLDADAANHELKKTCAWGLYIDELLSYTDHSDPITPETFFVTTDRQFSVRTVVDSDGNIVEERNYSPMGVDLEGYAETSDLAYGFTGRRYDSESDLYYFRARYYSTELGSFISRDPLNYVDGMSVYAGYFARRFANDPSGSVSLEVGNFRTHMSIESTDDHSAKQEADFISRHDNEHGSPTIIDRLLYSYSSNLNRGFRYKTNTQTEKTFELEALMWTRTDDNYRILQMSYFDDFDVTIKNTCCKSKKIWIIQTFSASLSGNADNNGNFGGGRGAGIYGYNTKTLQAEFKKSVFKIKATKVNLDNEKSITYRAGTSASWIHRSYNKKYSYVDVVVGYSVEVKCVKE